MRALCEDTPRGRKRRTLGEWRATLPTLRFGEAIEVFKDIKVFDVELGPARGAVGSSVAERHDQGHLLVLESECFFGRTADTLASVHELLRPPLWETEDQRLRESLGVDFGW